MIVEPQIASYDAAELGSATAFTAIVSMQP